MSEFWLKMLAQSLAREPALEGDELGGPPVLSPQWELQEKVNGELCKAIDELRERVAALEAKVAWLVLRWIGS